MTALLSGTEKLFAKQASLTLSVAIAYQSVA